MAMVDFCCKASVLPTNSRARRRMLFVKKKKSSCVTSTTKTLQFPCKSVPQSRWKSWQWGHLHYLVTLSKCPIIKEDNSKEDNVGEGISWSTNDSREKLTVPVVPDASKTGDLISLVWFITTFKLTFMFDKLLLQKQLNEFNSLNSSGNDNSSQNDRMNWLKWYGSNKSNTNEPIYPWDS